MNLVDLAQHFSDEDKARAFLEKQRWPDGAVCPHCGAADRVYKLTPKPQTVKSEGPKGKRKRTARKGLYKCGGCRKQFTVTVGTIFEDSHIPLHKWLMAVHLLCASKKGMSAHQLHRMLGVTYKSAWFMAHRVRYAMAQEPLSSKLSGILEADETYIGGRRKDPAMVRKAGERAVDRPSPFAGKAAVFSVLQRGGKVHSQHLQRVTSDTLKSALAELCADDAHVITDTARAYNGIQKTWKHSKVNHSASEYVRWDDGVCITTNAIEGYFSNLKRGINGVYHHVSKEHLHRYLSEFDFRFNSREVKDGERTVAALKGTNGKRLMLRDSKGREN